MYLSYQSQTILARIHGIYSCDADVLCVTVVTMIFANMRFWRVTMQLTGYANEIVYHDGYGNRYTSAEIQESTTSGTARTAKVCLNWHQCLPNNMAGCTCVSG